MKAIFKEYLKKSQAEVEPNVTLKRQLADQLFSQEPAKKSFWTWTKALFVSPFVAVFALIFLVTSNQGMEQVFLHPAALAQAIDNTFNLEHFQTTLGLPNDGQFNHRQVIYSGHYETSKALRIHFTRTTDLWTDGHKVREDILTASNTPPHPNPLPNFVSNLINPDIDEDCLFMGSEMCHSLSEYAKFNESETFSEYFMTHRETYDPVEKETLISNLSITPVYDSPQGPIYVVEWSTKELMSEALLKNSYNAHGGAIDFINDHEKNAPYTSGDNYVNSLRDGRYWHKINIHMPTSFLADKTYFQFVNHDADYPEEFLSEEQKSAALKDNIASMIYEVNRTSGKISVLTPEQFVEIAKSQKPLTSVLSEDELYDPTGKLQDLVFFLKHEQFSQPVSVQAVDKNEKRAIQVQYALPESFLKMWDHESIARMDSINFYLDETQTYFLGYDLIDKNGKLLESVWIKDEVLPDTEKPKIFDKEAWQETISQKLEAQKS